MQNEGSLKFITLCQILSKAFDKSGGTKGRLNNFRMNKGKGNRTIF